MSEACRVCNTETNVIVNIRLKAVHVCDACCLTITKQTVMSLTLESLLVRWEDDSKVGRKK